MDSVYTVPKPSVTLISKVEFSDEAFTLNMWLLVPVGKEAVAFLFSRLAV